MRVDPGLIAADIELEHPQRRRRRLRYLFEAGLADRAQHMRDAELIAPCTTDAPPPASKISSEPTGESTTGSRSLRPKCHRGIDLAHVAQHARTQRDRVERQAVAPQRRLGFRPADDVVPIVLVEVCRALATSSCRLKIAGCRRGVVDRSGLVGAILHDEPIGLEEVGERRTMMLIPAIRRQPARAALAPRSAVSDAVGW